MGRDKNTEAERPVLAPTVARLSREKSTEAARPVPTPLTIPQSPPLHGTEAARPVPSPITSPHHQSYGAEVERPAPSRDTQAPKLASPTSHLHLSDDVEAERPMSNPPVPCSNDSLSPSCVNDEVCIKFEVEEPSLSTVSCVVDNIGVHNPDANKSILCQPLANQRKEKPHRKDIDLTVVEEPVNSPSIQDLTVVEEPVECQPKQDLTVVEEPVKSQPKPNLTVVEEPVECQPKQDLTVVEEPVKSQPKPYLTVVEEPAKYQPTRDLTEVEKPVMSVVSPVSKTSSHVSLPVQSVSLFHNNDNTEVEKPVPLIETEVEKPVTLNKTEVEKPVTLYKTEVEKPVPTTITEVEEPVSLSSKTEVEKPVIEPTLSPDPFSPEAEVSIPNTKVREVFYGHRISKN